MKDLDKDQLLEIVKRSQQKNLEGQAAMVKELERLAVALDECVSLLEFSLPLAEKQLLHQKRHEEGISDVHGSNETRELLAVAYTEWAMRKKLKRPSLSNKKVYERLSELTGKYPDHLKKKIKEVRDRLVAEGEDDPLAPPKK